MKTEYEIGGQVYTRQELLAFGKRHYPKFYWIKRGIGIGLMASFGLSALILLVCGLAMGNLAESGNEYMEIAAQPYYGSAAVCSIGLIVGIVLFAVSFNPLPDESYIKHAIDYYTKLDRQNQRIEARKAQRSGGVTPDQLLKYKELLDKGAISQEEFDAKKKELL